MTISFHFRKDLFCGSLCLVPPPCPPHVCMCASVLSFHVCVCVLLLVDMCLEVITLA